LHRTNAATWFNKACKYKQLTPNYICIKIKGNNPQCRKTIKAATLYRLNQELKFLYVKKQNLNEQLYKLHLECASSWQKSWHLIQSSIDYKLRQMETHYTHLNKKVDHLQEKQRIHTTAPHNQEKQQFYPRIIANIPNIKFVLLFLLCGCML
jgi:hypothetical protein